MTERREHPRFATACVFYVSRAGEKNGPFVVVDASESGLYLAMQERPEVGMTVVIETRIGDRFVLLIGEVVRHVDGTPGTPMPAGIGLKLTAKPKDWAELVKGLAAESPSVTANKSEWTGGGDQYVLRTDDGYVAVLNRIGLRATASIQGNNGECVYLNTWTVLPNEDWNELARIHQKKLVTMILDHRRERSSQ